MSGERHSERYLRAVVQLLHGVELEQFDLDGRQRAVDYVFTSPDGVAGAVEMTTYRDGRAAALERKMNDGETMTCDSPRGWAVRVELGTKLDVLRRRLPSVIAACDRHGVDDPALLPVSESGADVQWFVSTGLGLSPSTLSQPGTVGVFLPPTAGFPRNDNLDRDLARMLSDRQIASKLSKLKDHPGVTERHLAVAVDAYKPGFDLYDHLLFEHGYVPRFAPPPDLGVTHMWITAGSHSVLAWTPTGGWGWRAIQ